MSVIHRLWPNHKIATASLLFSGFEIIVVWGAAAAVPAIGEHSILLRSASFAWILGGLGSLLLAALALIVDRQRQMGLVCFAVALVAFFICGLPMLV